MRWPLGRRLQPAGCGADTSPASHAQLACTCSSELDRPGHGVACDRQHHRHHHQPGEQPSTCQKLQAEQGPAAPVQDSIKQRAWVTGCCSRSSSRIAHEGHKHECGLAMLGACSMSRVLIIRCKVVRIRIRMSTFPPSVNTFLLMHENVVVKRFLCVLHL